MGTVYITEFSDTVRFPNGNVVQVALGPCVTDQSPITTSGSSQQSAAFAAGTRMVRLHTTSVISVVVGGTNPTATTSKMRLPADTIEYFGVQQGDKIAVIDNT